MAVLIKRYANRKLYNTQTSRYITLKGIAELIETGREIRVIDNESGEDITSVTLSQILVDSERANRSVPGTILSELISRGGDVLYTALRKGIGNATDGVEDLQRGVRKFIGAREREVEKLADFVAYATPDLDKVLQAAVERALRILDLPRRSDLDSLNKNLERVATALEALEPAPAPAEDQPENGGPGA